MGAPRPGNGWEKATAAAATGSCGARLHTGPRTRAARGMIVSWSFQLLVWLAVREREGREALALGVVTRGRPSRVGT